MNIIQWLKDLDSMGVITIEDMKSLENQLITLTAKVKAKKAVGEKPKPVEKPTPVEKPKRKKRYPR